MPRKPATEEQRAAIRKKIRDAARHVYREKGISGVSARAIAVAAGVSVGTIYSYFGDLATLMQSLWAEPLESINARFREIAASHVDPLERLRALMTAYVAVGADNPELYRSAFLFVRPAHLDQPNQDDPDSVVFVALVRRALLEGQNAGIVRSGSVDELAQLIWAGLHGSIALPINFDRIRFDDHQRISSQMIDLLIAQLAA